MGQGTRTGSRRPPWAAPLLATLGTIVEGSRCLAWRRLRPDEAPHQLVPDA